MQYIVVAIFTAIVVGVAPKTTVVDEPSPPIVQASPEVVEEKPVKPKKAKHIKKKPVVDPKGCEPEQYWDAEPPHNCIDKPASASARHAEVNRTTTQPSPVSGDWVARCKAWASQAAVPLNQSALNLIEKESHCNPNAENPSSGACGIGQQLPCGKWKHQWNDPVGGLKDMYSYVINRYGSWDNAWATWLNNKATTGNGWY